VATYSAACLNTSLKPRVRVALANFCPSAVSSRACVVIMSNCRLAWADQIAAKSEGAWALARSCARSNTASAFACAISMSLPFSSRMLASDDAWMVSA